MSSRRRFLMGMCLENYARTNFPYVYHNLIYGNKTKLAEYIGKSAVENQLVDVDDKDFYLLNVNVKSSSATGEISFNGTANASDQNTTNVLKSMLSFVANKKYLIYFVISGTIPQVRIGNFGSYVGNYYSSTGGYILTASADASDIRLVSMSTNGTAYNGNLYVQVIDLTQEFGAGLEPTSLTDRRIQKIINDGYKPKNDGSMKSTIVKDIEFRGFNIWDEMWELGGIDNTTGALFGATDRIRSKNYIKVIGGETYYIKMPSGWGWAVWCYDANKNFIVRKTDITQTMPSNCAYIMFCVYSQTSYSSGICINCSSSMNGQYKPFKSFNIFNSETCTDGYIDVDGTITQQNDRSVSDFIAIQPSTEYYGIKLRGIADGSRGIIYYNANKQFVSYASLGNDYTYTGTFSTPSGAYFMRVNLYTSNKFDICVNESDPKLNGTYLPFGILSKISLPAPLLMRGALNVHDTFEITNTAYVFTKNVGKVKAKDLDWVRTTYGGKTYFNYTITGKALGNDILSSMKYPFGGNGQVETFQEGYWYSSAYNSTIYVLDSTYTNATDFKNHFTTEDIYYELATPQVISIPKRHLKAVDLGSLSWTLVVERFTATLNDAKASTSDSVVNNLFVSNYGTQSWYYGIRHVSENLVYSLSSSGNITIGLNDSSCTTTAQLQAKLSGVYLFYETASEVADTIAKAETETGGEVNTCAFEWVENQLVNNGNFANGTSSWTNDGGNVSVANGIASFIATQTNGNLYNVCGSTIGHKYLAIASIKLTTTTNKVKLYSYRLGISSTAVSTTEWQTVAGMGTAINTGGNIQVLDERTSGWDTIQVKNVRTIDLTLAFPNDTPTSIDDYRIQEIINKGYIATNTTGTYKHEQGSVLCDLVLGVRK